MATVTVTLKTASGGQAGQQSYTTGENSPFVVKDWSNAFFHGGDAFVAFWADYVLCLET